MERRVGNLIEVYVDKSMVSVIEVFFDVEMRLVLNIVW